MASKKKNLTTIDERTRSQNSRYDPFHHLEPRQGRTVFGFLLGHCCSRHWRVAVRVFNAPEALSLTCRCRGGGLIFILSTKNMSFVIYAGPVGLKATRCLCFLREDRWIWCCYPYLGLGLEESAAIIWRVVEYMILDMTWYGCSDILTPVFSPLVQSLHRLYKCANCWLISLWRISLRSEHKAFFHCLHCSIPFNTHLLHF